MSRLPRDGQGMYKIIRELVDEFPNLRTDEKKLVWCVWVRLGYATEYSFNFESYLRAPLESTILRRKRQVFEDHPPYKFSDKKECPIKKTDS